MTKFKKLISRRDGAAAIEFAMLILPLALLIFVILEIALIFYVDTSLDSALQKAARKVRVGAGSNWTINDFKDEVCSNIAGAFSCKSSLLVRATVVTKIDSVAYSDATSNGVLTLNESYDTGESGDYVLIQAFLPWQPVIPLYTFSSSTLSDGTYILGAAALFKNEPF